jgi:hypothetical protein
MTTGHVVGVVPSRSGSSRRPSLRPHDVLEGALRITRTLSGEGPACREHGMGIGPGDDGGRDYWAVIAPSATMSAPVTNEDSSEARNSATLAISRGSPGRPIGWKESIVS